MTLFSFLFVNLINFNFSQTYCNFEKKQLIWNKKHYELEKFNLEENKKDLNFIFNTLGGIWEIIWTFNFSKNFKEVLTNRFNTIFPKVDEIDNLENMWELELEIIEIYNKIVHYNCLLNLYLEELTYVEECLDQVKKLEKATNVFSLKISILMDREELKEGIEGINHQLVILKQKYDKDLLTNLDLKNPKYFLIPMVSFKLNKILYYIKNSYKFKINRAKFNRAYGSFFTNLNGFLYFRPKNNEFSMDLDESFNLEESLKRAYEMEWEWVCLKRLWKSMFINIKGGLLNLFIKKKQINLLLEENKIQEKRLLKLEKIKDFRFFSKKYKLQKKIYQTKRDIINIQRLQCECVWVLFSKIIPIQYCLNVYLYKPKLV